MINYRLGRYRYNTALKHKDIVRNTSKYKFAYSNGVFNQRIRVYNDHWAMKEATSMSPERPTASYYTFIGCIVHKMLMNYYIRAPDSNDDYES